MFLFYECKCWLIQRAVPNYVQPNATATLVVEDDDREDEATEETTVFNLQAGDSLQHQVVLPENGATRMSDEEGYHQAVAFGVGFHSPEGCLHKDLVPTPEQDMMGRQPSCNHTNGSLR